MNAKDRTYNRRMAGSGTESSRLADEAAKRRWPRQHNAAGARASGLRRSQWKRAVRTPCRRNGSRRPLSRSDGQTGGSTYVAGIRLSVDATVPGRAIVSLTAPELRAGPWENPMSRNLRGGAGNVAYGGTVNPPRLPKGRGWKPSTYGCARQCSTRRGGAARLAAELAGVSPAGANPSVAP